MRKLMSNFTFTTFKAVRVKKKISKIQGPFKETFPLRKPFKATAKNSTLFQMKGGGGAKSPLPPKLFFITLYRKVPEC